MTTNSTETSDAPERKVVPDYSHAQPSIILDHVSKWFNKRTTHSFKEAFINWVKRKSVRTQ
jgi:hypothetical protein